MASLNVKFEHKEYSDSILNSSIHEILDSNILCAISSIENGNSYIHTAYYCFNGKLDLFYLSDPETQHARNIMLNPSVAIAIYDSRQEWDGNKKGLQLFGECTQARGKLLAEGTLLYLKRFTGLKQWIKHPDDFVKGAINSQMFVIKTKGIKLFDEDKFGEENFISLYF